jgi:hypothetical protein
MSDARSLTPLSEVDYETIAGAVMETARGRWFLAEFARRNRQADTEMVLGAIQRLERLCTVQSAGMESALGFTDAARAIAELREDLDRAGVGQSEPALRLSARIHEAANRILTAAEAIQEAAWTLRESGSDRALCDSLDRRATEIYTATTTVEAGADQIEKLADTVAMLDSSLRATMDDSSFTLGAAAPKPQPAAMPAAPVTAADDIDVVDVGTQLRTPLNEAAAPAPRSPYSRLGSDRQTPSDIAFLEPQMAAAPVSAAQVELSYSEADLRAIGALPVVDRLRLFA